MRAIHPANAVLATAAVAATFAFAAADASAAATCYTVFDRQGEIVYRAFAPPFEGAGDYTTPGRQAMRARGENLVFFDATFCPPVASVGGIGGRSYTTEEIVAAFPGYAVRPDGSTIGARYGVLPTRATPGDSVNVGSDPAR
jgi:hypothetical protein